MPKSVEKQFKKSARAQHLHAGSQRYNAYVYGGMEKRGLLASKRRLVGLKKRSSVAKKRS